LPFVPERRRHCQRQRQSGLLLVALRQQALRQVALRQQALRQVAPGQAESPD
jgi:hypothetical protein